MRISYNWLKEFVEMELTPQQAADKLTMAGLEVEGLEYLGEGIGGVVVGHILAINSHPNADKLTVCDVDTGNEVLNIVCGAKNMKAGDKVPLAMIGATLPGGLKITKGKLRGVESFGMLCSDKELGLAKESSGLLILPEDATVGEDIVKTVGLDDWAMEINVTPNRPDALSVFGVARELAAIIRKPLTKPQGVVKETGDGIKNLVKIDIEDDTLCPRYAGRMITSIKIGPSPEWMQRRLTTCGMRPINNIVDVTNYVMLEMGQPLHAFDYDLLRDQQIVVRPAEEGEKFTSLDGVERVLSADMLLICDGERPVAVAGVMGGMNSEVSESTKNIFIESAYFNSISVRRSSKKLGLHTEASHRFERGTDPEGVTAALDRATALMAELAGGKVATGRLDEYPNQVKTAEVTVRTARVNEILGSHLEKSEMADILRRLQFWVEDSGSDSIMVRVPAFRPDLEREIDIIEEIARIHGYGKIKSTMPDYKMTPGSPDKVRESSADVKGSMLCLGYNEVINYSFIDPRDYDRILLADGDYRRQAVQLQNPLSADQSVLRTTLLPSLLNNLSLNYSRGVRELKIFELSKVFWSEGPGLPKEPLMVAGLAVGSRTGSLWDARDGGVDFYDIKGVVERLLDSLDIKAAVYRPEPEEPFLHPGKSAWVMVGGKKSGYVGQLHPDVQANFGLPVEVFVFELELEDLIHAAIDKKKYRQLPKYPAIERDIAAIVPVDVSSFSIIKAIESLRLPLFEDVRVFDQYVGKPIPDGKKSLAYTVTYRSADRTLTDAEVNDLHQAVMNALREKLGAEIREQ